MRRRLALSTFIALSGCAGTSRARGAGATVHPPVPVYFALSPPFPYEVVREIDLSLSGERAHLEDLVTEAETHARGADAIVIREVQSEARLVTQQIWRTCTSVGPGGRSYQYSCPDVVQTLLVDSRLSAVAVRRSAGTNPQSQWTPPPPLAATGPVLPARSQAPRDELPSLDETLGEQ